MAIIVATETEYGIAEIFCQKNSGNLVSIHDAFTNVIVAQNASAYFHQLPDFWIGANSLTTKNVWKWTDGSSFDFNDWGKSEPKNTSDSMCASVSMNDGYWSAENCFTYKPFVCEILNADTITTTMKTTEKTLSSTKKKTTKTTTTSVRTTSTVTNATSSPPPFPVFQNCSSGWTYFAPTNSFYCGNYSSFLTWNESEKYCKSIGGHLTSVHSDLEKRLIWAYFIYLGCYNKQPWIGLYSADVGKTYQWTDGSNLDYQKWVDGSPNIYGGACVILSSYSCGVDTEGFYNWGCSELRGIICKKT
uniref:C-type lectin domain-containing protein n=1 Tax=Panagrolaimus sp. PS1159 TaxID=55785 RepID=A0AC35F9P4_9BILA